MVTPQPLEGMMNEPKDGGPAFPACNEANVNGTMGMSLRDWFAGQAMLALVIKMGNHVQFPSNRSDTALTAYQMADEMLGRRGGKP